MAGAARPKVLVADDYEPNVDVLVAVLEPLGFEVVKAFSGQAALALADQESYAAMLLDLRMPDLDGASVAVHARRGSTNASTPILLLTGDESTVDPSVRARFEVIEKPYRPSALIARLEALLAAEARPPASEQKQASD